MTQFLVLPALRAMVGGLKDDLGKLRAMNAEQAKEIAQYSSERFAPDYAETQKGRIREKVQSEADSLLSARNTDTNVSLVAAQERFWSMGSFYKGNRLLI